MSYSLLNQQDIEQTFLDISQIALILENVTGKKRAPGESDGAENETEATSGKILTIAPVLTLPPSCDAATLKKVSNIGRGLTLLVDRLRRQIDSHLVEFIAHQNKKELGILDEICSKRRIIPKGFLSHTQTVGMQLCDSYPSSPANCSPREPEAKGVEFLSPLPVDATFGRSIFSFTHGGDGGTLSGFHRATSPNVSSGSGSPPARHSPLAKKLKERREAASTLQSFLFLALESSIAQCDASCAAIFINGVSFSLNVSRQLVVRERGRKLRIRPAGQNSSNEESSLPKMEADDTPHFLHCIANLYGEGIFPNEVNFAVTNPLTSVVQSGVALNFCNTEAPKISSFTDRTQYTGHIEDLPNESIQKNVKRVLNINNGLIFPLCDFGCIVLANKKSSSAVRSFTVSDEHTMWGASLLISRVLSRYQRDLLLDNTWFPAHIPCLQRFLTLPVTNEMQKLGGSKKHGKEHLRVQSPHCPEIESTVSQNFGSLATGILKFISEGRGATMPLRMTVVRTADPDLIHAVPSDLLGPRRQTAATDQITEEEIFQGAAEYIMNLESLWHKTLAENNAAHLLIDNYDKEIETRNEEIRSLERKIRALNIKIVQLERQKGHS